MMKTMKVIFIILPFLFWACTKYDHKPPPDENFSACQIQTLHFNLRSAGYEDSITFAYNNLGNPIAGIRGNVSTGAPNFIFRYDNYNRLKELIGLYDTSDLENVDNLHKYSYDSYNRIIRDSLYYFPEIINGKPANNNQLVIVDFEYDSENRISKVTTLFFGTTNIKNYTYNQDGNLDGILYDDKINFHRTNKIWMFLDRDYSVNNPVNANYSYNDFNLPVKIVYSPGSSNTFLNFGQGSLTYDSATIKYYCR